MSRPSHLKERATRAGAFDGAFDPSSGMRYERRRLCFPEIYRLRYDPDSIAPSPPLPVGVQAVFEDVFPEESKNGTLKFALHPWFKRWCLFEMVEGNKRSPAGWQLVQLFDKRNSKGEDYLPSDLAFSDHRCDDLRGNVGDYAPPDREWMEWVKARCDTRRNSTEEMLEFLNLEEAEKKRHTECEHEAMTHDFHSHYFNLFRDLSAIEMGGISRSMQVNQTSLDEIRQRKAENLREYIIEFEGVKHLVRHGSRHEADVLAKMEKKTQDREKFLDDLETRKDKEHMLRESRRIALGRETNSRRVM